MVVIGIRTHSSVKDENPWTVNVEDTSQAYADSTLCFTLFAYRIAIRDTFNQCNF